MTHFEIMAQKRQTSIFEYILIGPNSKRNNGFEEGDYVKIRFYTDEFDFIYNCHPQLLEEGIIIEKQHDFYKVKFANGNFVDVPGEKLTLA